MREGFYYLEICDDTEHFNLETLKGWATEPTLRGAFLRRMLQRLEAAAIYGSGKSLTWPWLRASPRLQGGNDDALRVKVKTVTLWGLVPTGEQLNIFFLTSLMSGWRLMKAVNRPWWQGLGDHFRDPADH